MVLVDTSIWIQVFRKESPLDLSAIVDLDDVVTCLPVIQEVLQGFRHRQAFQIARDAMLALPRVESPLTTPVFEEAVGLYRSARQGGWTIRSGVDCLIAACALRNSLTILHRDRDYSILARVSALAEHHLITS
jgi:predicted nucleic acid-binding protein